MITAGQIRAMVTSEIALWLPGYTEPGNDDIPAGEAQRRVTIEHACDGVLTIRADPAGWSEEKAQRFRVVLLVEEI